MKLKKKLRVKLRVILNDTGMVFANALDTFQPDLLPPDCSLLTFWETKKNSILYGHQCKCLN